MIINIAHTKGGVGKTMIATNLSIALVAPIIDLDIQRSSQRFFSLREMEGLPVLPVYNALTNELINTYKGNLEKHIIIDSGGMDNDVIRAGLESADLIITPVSVSQVAFFVFQDFNDLLTLAGHSITRDNTYILFNNINLQAKKEIEQARTLVQDEFDFKLFTTMLGSRKAYKEAYAVGQNTVEVDPTSKASQEMIHLINEIKEICNK